MTDLNIIFTKNFIFFLAEYLKKSYTTLYNFILSNPLIFEALPLKSPTTELWSTLKSSPCGALPSSGPALAIYFCSSPTSFIYRSFSATERLRSSQQYPALILEQITTGTNFSLIKRTFFFFSQISFPFAHHLIAPLLPPPTFFLCNHS